MTCFWDGIMGSLNKNDKKELGLNDNNIYTLIEILQKKNIKTENIKWQRKKLTDRELKENMKHIGSYKKSTAKGGYLCGTQDPFLLLLCFLLKRKIHFIYCGTLIEYEPFSVKKETLKYKCDRGHFVRN